MMTSSFPFGPASGELKSVEAHHDFYLRLDEI